MNTEPGPFLPCWRCGRQPHVDRDGAYVYIYCGDCYDEGDIIGATYCGLVSAAGADWDNMTDMEEPRWT